MAEWNRGGFVLPLLATRCWSTDPAPESISNSRVEAKERKRTCRFSPNRDPVRIATKLGDVTLDPLQCELLVNWKKTVSEKGNDGCREDVRKPAFNAPSFFTSSPAR